MLRVHFPPHHIPPALDRRVVVELRQLWRGQYFGELGTITKTVRSASVISMTQCDCLLLSKVDCFRLAMDSGDVADRMTFMARQVSERSDAQHEMFSELSGISIDRGYSPISHQILSK